MHETLQIRTRGQGLTEITGSVARLASRARDDGIVHLFIRHTSASLLIQENADPDVRVDLLAYLHRLVPPADDPAMAYLTHVLEGPDDMPAHIKAALLPVSLQVPVQDGRLLLGTWQGIYLVEHRTRPQVREVIVTLP